MPLSRQPPPDPERLDPVIEVYKRDVDLGGLRENLRLTPEERLRNLMAWQRFVGEAQRAMQRARARPGRT